MTSEITTHTRRPQPSRPHWWRRRGARAAVLSLALTAGLTGSLAATPAWAAAGYHVTYIGVGSYPASVAVSPDGTRAYVANRYAHSVSVIDTAANRVTATIGGLSTPVGVAVSPDGTHIYVTNYMARGTLAVITRQ